MVDYTFQNIDIGALGDNLPTGGQKINDNFGVVSDAFAIDASTFAVAATGEMSSPAFQKALMARSLPAGSNLSLIGGTVRQQQPVSTTITRSGTTATAVKNGHGYVIGNEIVVKDAVPTAYNGLVTIIAVTANTFDYTVSGSPTTPATGTITSYRPALWQWVLDSQHTPTGFDTTIDLIAVGSALTIPFDETFGKVISVIAGPDETLANFYNFSCGGSVGLSSIVLKASVALEGGFSASYDGAAWSIVNTSIGTANMTPILSGTGTDLTVTHNYLPGPNVAVTRDTADGAYTPLAPAVRRFSDASQTVVLNFLEPSTNNFSPAPAVGWSFRMIKSYAGDIPLDGSNGSHQLNLYAGNIWMLGAMLVA